MDFSSCENRKRAQPGLLVARSRAALPMAPNRDTDSATIQIEEMAQSRQNGCRTCGLLGGKFATDRLSISGVNRLDYLPVDLRTE